MGPIFARDGYSFGDDGGSQIETGMQNASPSSRYALHGESRLTVRESVIKIAPMQIKMFSENGATAISARNSSSRQRPVIDFRILSDGCFLS